MLEPYFPSTARSGLSKNRKTGRSLAAGKKQKKKPARKYPQYSTESNTERTFVAYCRMRSSAALCWLTAVAFQCLCSLPPSPSLAPWQALATSALWPVLYAQAAVVARANGARSLSPQRLPLLSPQSLKAQSSALPALVLPAFPQILPSAGLGIQSGPGCWPSRKQQRIASTTEGCCGHWLAEEGDMAFMICRISIQSVAS